MPQLQKAPEKKIYESVRSGHGSGNDGGDNISKSITKKSSVKNVKIWLVTISVFFLFLHLIPPSIDKIKIFGVMVGPIEGYQEIVNVVLAFGLYRVATIIVMTIPSTTIKNKLRIALNLSSNELATFSPENLVTIIKLDSHPFVTRFIWFLLEWIIQFFQIIVLLVVFSSGAFSAVKILYSSLTVSSLPAPVSMVVILLTSIFLIITALRVIQGASFPISIYMDNKFSIWKKRYETIREKKIKEHLLNQQEEKKKMELAKKEWLDNNSLLIELVKTANDTVLTIKARWAVFGKEYFKSDLLKATEKFTQALEYYKNNREFIVSSHLDNSITSVSMLLSEANSLDVDSQNFENLISELMEKYKKDIDLLDCFNKDPVKFSPLKLV